MCSTLKEACFHFNTSICYICILMSSSVYDSYRIEQLSLFLWHILFVSNMFNLIFFIRAVSFLPLLVISFWGGLVVTELVFTLLYSHLCSHSPHILIHIIYSSTSLSTKTQKKLSQLCSVDGSSRERMVSALWTCTVYLTTFIASICFKTTDSNCLFLNLQCLDVWVTSLGSECC